ncbi:uracil DNA glycosylase [Saitozyma podzolica]|uniref:Uracil-DNA glycosylase n=1 Tax=Saitozyma podzolica TaxID=1890683 RepID=A0A427Y262_9TREE|nr:uracil DNA glycosylase [Saitozyma podzolica]
MPPQPARSISSYFTKPAASVSVAASSSSTTKSRTAATSPNGTILTTSSTVINATYTASISSSPHGPGSSQSSAPSTQKRLLSDRARQAIIEAAESPAKKARIEGPNGTKVAEVFTKVTKPADGKALSLPRGSSREELRAALAEHPHTAQLLNMELNTLGEDWLVALQGELTKPYFLSLKEFVTGEQERRKVFPPIADVYSWSRLCPLKDIRVVIVGQDPYHDDGQAHGLAFSVRRGVRIPPSLRNIYKQMADDVPGFKIPTHGDLSEWAKHGVLLLNTSLTVRAHEAASHSNKGWEQFTAAVLRVVTSRLAPVGDEHVPGANGVCFMAWGAHAQKMCAGVDGKKHLVLKSAHPSPLAAHRGFFGNGHFQKANEWLRERYGPDGGIDWAALGG